MNEKGHCGLLFKSDQEIFQAFQLRVLIVDQFSVKNHFSIAQITQLRNLRD